MEEYVILKSYDNKLVRVPILKKDEYLKTQEYIKHLLKQGKTKEEIFKLLEANND